MDVDSRQLVAQWAYDTHAVLARFHLWLEAVEIERAQPDEVSSRAFTPRGITRSLAMTAAATALGTRLFGHFGEGRGADKATTNQVKKAADAVSAYALSEGLWHLTRALPENHAVMVSLGEGLMPKAGETPEMGANPLLGFGRVYARPEVARIVDDAVRRLLNDRAWHFDEFRARLRARGITVWGAAVDTLENTSRFADGQAIGPMTVLHLFDTPLRVTRPYEAYMGCLTVPRAVVAAASDRSELLDFRTPRAQVLAAIERAYPGVARADVHVWTLRGASRATRLGPLWAEWAALGVHLVEDGWRAPSGLPVFVDSGTYAPTFLVGAWRDARGATHVFLCDGYAASAEAVQAASLAEVLDVDATMAPFSATFDQPIDREDQLMRLAPARPAFAAAVAAITGRDDPAAVARLAGSIELATSAEIPLGRRVIRADDLLPDKGWRVLATTGYIGDDPYTGAPGVERLADDRYRVTTGLATRDARSRVRFTVRLLDGLERARDVWSPLLVRCLTGTAYQDRPAKISYSGRIRNELQTMFSTALEHDGTHIRVCFDRIDARVLPPGGKDALRRALAWYCERHPARGCYAGRPMPSSLLALLDDISLILDDVVVLTGAASKKTAGVLGDDLALNAQQVAGVKADRELPVVWAVAKGSLRNKAIIVPAAFVISLLAPWLVLPLLMIGGAFLCYEGCHKLAHRWLHSPAEDRAHHEALVAAVADPTIDLVAAEREKIRGAVRTDFILSAEIIVITLGTVADASVGVRIAVLCAIALVMTIGVYGLVAGIVRLDDAGRSLLARDGAGARGLGRAILAFAPRLMRFLAIAGTAAMFMVGGGIVAHAIGPVHHAIEDATARADAIATVGGALAWLVPSVANALVGIVVGAIVLVAVLGAGRVIARVRGRR